MWKAHRFSTPSSGPEERTFVIFAASSVLLGQDEASIPIALRTVMIALMNACARLASFLSDMLLALARSTF
jgi:hypothetical protein